MNAWLLEVARSGTAAQLERVVSAWKRFGPEHEQPMGGGVDVRGEDGDLIPDLLDPIGGIGGLRHGTSYL